MKCQTTFTKGSLFWVECECGVGCGAECGEFNNPIDAILSWGLKEMEQLQARIKELESDAHINEIKARAIEEAVEEAAIDCNVTDGPVIVLEKVRNYADKLRGKHD